MAHLESTNIVFILTHAEQTLNKLIIIMGAEMFELVLLPLHASKNHQAFRGANTSKLNVP